MNRMPVRRKRIRRGGPVTTTGYICLIVKLTILLGLWIALTFVLLTHKSHDDTDTLVTVMPQQKVFKKLHMEHESVEIILRGAINKYLTNHLIRGANFSAVGIRVEWRDPNLNRSYLRTPRWKVYLSKDKRKYNQVERIFHFAISGKYQDKALDDPTGVDWGYAHTVISFESMCRRPVGLFMKVDTMPMVGKYAVMYSALLLIGLYVVIIWELTDRTLCTLLLTAAGLALLTVLGNRPSFGTIISWVEWESMMLLLGNLIMITLMAETGFFDYLAVVAYRISKGNSWFLIALLGIVVFLFSVFLDAATVVLLFSPAVIRLCEAMALKTTLVLIILALYANIGGSVTPVGGPPNVIIATNMNVAGVSFINFSIHMLPTAIICMITIFILVYLILGKRIFILDENQMELIKNRQDEMRSSFDVQLRTAELIRNHPARTLLRPAPNYFQTLAYLEAKHWIRKKMLLVHSVLALIFAISCFALQSIPWAIPGASLGWISILAAFLLLILADKEDLTDILDKIEWSTLLFLASLFILTEVVSELGFIHWLGIHAVDLIVKVDEQHQNMVGMLLILWLSAIMSAFIDNAVVATIMVKLCIEMAYHENVAVTLMPLIWATSFGTSYGANGTLLGSMANEFVSVIGRQYGYEITFRTFFVVGFPIMLVTVAICSMFLVIAHSVFDWH
ncbi:P protein [Drosophila rhopaloa]|uniref:P protein n=1 Tax=Drosophila rhopaloa TaxID=1041015 RepID=A0A6P4FMC2_DRORH|nr:P protein [Drosophila rhopaloa]